MREVYKHLFAIVVLPLVMLLTGCNSEGAFSGPTVALQRIDITASPITTQGLSSLTLAVDNKQPFSAIGHYSDNSSRILTDFSVNDWHSSDEDIGCFDAPGILTGVDTGSITVTVSKDGITSNAVNVEVTAAVITDITVTPSIVSVAKNQTEQLVATATYSDNSSSDISSSVIWTPMDTSTATITPSGLLTGIDIGSTTLTATKDGITSNIVNINVTAATITTISVAPSIVSVAKNQTEQLVATATYSDNSSSDISSSVIWTPMDTSTATITPSGLLTGIDIGSTTLTATKDGITSNTVNVNICNDLAGPCIDFFDTGSGKLFTNSPSVSYLDSIGGSATDDISIEDGTKFGPSGNFYRFNWTNAYALCTTYNTQVLAGRSNWRLATRDELVDELHGVYNNMFTARGWPTVYRYRSGTINGSLYYNVYLFNGHVRSVQRSYPVYASCVSDPS